MGVHVEFAGFCMMMIVLAISLSVVGYGISKLLNRVFDARREEKMKAEGLFAAAKSRADARRTVRA
jgi:Na+-transporting methylmalonyl-CoA/oxaloacetate decarboxylase gamma subunit